MGRDIDDLRRIINGKRSDGNGDSVFQATVESVDEKEFTCTVRKDDLVNYEDVRLRGLVKADLKGFAFIPVVGSTVLVSRIGRSNELFVCQYTEVDKLIFTSGDVSLTCNQEKIELLKGDKLSVLIDTESITVKADQATIKTGIGGLTLTKGSSGLKKTLDDLLTAILALTVTTGVGPSGTPINAADFQKVQQDLSNYLEG